MMISEIIWYMDVTLMKNNETNPKRQDHSDAIRGPDRFVAMRRENLERVLPIDELQMELTEKWIVPILPEIEEHFLDIRMAVDLELPGRFYKDSTSTGALKYTKRYPIGFCLQITDHVLTEFEKRHAEHPTKIGLAIDAFRRNGGHFHRVWGILREQYFQNAMQIGSYYFDTANDTVDPSKPKVEYMPMAESGFRNVTSFEDFATIMQKYCGGKIYPNSHFPAIAPLMPLIWISEEGDLTIQSRSKYMLRLNLESDFRLAERFLTRSEWAHEELPADIAARLQRFKDDSLPKKSRTPLAGVSHDISKAKCEEYRRSRIDVSFSLLGELIDWGTRVVIKVDGGVSSRNGPGTIATTAKTEPNPGNP